MIVTRREFLRKAGTAGVAGSVLATGTRPTHASSLRQVSEDWMGVLVDIPNCIGCRKCEYACQESAGFTVPPIQTFDDKSVMAAPRRPTPKTYTVINAFPNPRNGQQSLYVKANCLHCNAPACMSACLVGAFEKQPDGAVVYDASKCMGCRYCMVACPFQIPTYDYDNALTPQVRKCNLCAHRVPDEQPVPACVEICPQQCLTYGKRTELLELAHDKIRRRPDLYVDHIYGEHEAGGTAWLYLSSVPFDQLAFPNLASTAPPRLTEAIQHGVFKHFVPPIALYVLLGIIMWLSRQDASESGESTALPGAKRRRGAAAGPLRERQAKEREGVPI